MKKRLKGLACIWLAVIMLFAMLPVLTTPAVADGVGDDAALGRVALIRDIVDEDGRYNYDVISGKNSLVLDEPLNEQTEIMDAVNAAKPEGCVLEGWRLWYGTGSGGFIRELVYDTQPVSKVLDDSVTTDEYNDYIVNDQRCFALEPLWAWRYKIDPQPTSEMPTVGAMESAGDGDVWTDITDPENVLYQWYTYEETRYMVVKTDSPDADEVDASIWEGTYDSGERIWTCSESGEVDIGFPVLAGDIVQVTPVDTAAETVLVTEFNGPEFDYDPESGAYTMTMMEDDEGFNLYIQALEGDSFAVEIIRFGVDDPVDGQTTKTLTANEDGVYVCKVTFYPDGDNIVLYSDPVEYEAKGALTVTNTVDSSLAIHKNKVFTFTVELRDTTINGEYGDMIFEGGVAIIQLKDGESATATGLPCDIEYLVTPATEDSYILLSREGYEGIATVYVATAAFIYVPSPFVVEVEAANGGTATASQESATMGETVTITVAADSGYVLESLIVDGEDVTDAVTEGEYTFTMPAHNVSVSAVFAAMETPVLQGHTSGGHRCTSVCEICGGCKDKSCTYNVCAVKCLLPMPFIDVEEGQWYTGAVEYVYHHGIMQGVSQNLFDLNSTTTRAMLVTMLWRMEGEPVMTGPMPFEDVPANTWYTEAVRWAASKGIVNGISETVFGVTDPITREQLVTILWRYAKYKGYDVSVGENTNILSYDDAFYVADWAIPAMQWACGSGMIQGIADGNQMNLEPQGNAVRAQVAASLQRFCENVASKD